jgi:hypothetical protein
MALVPRKVIARLVSVSGGDPAELSWEWILRADGRVYCRLTGLDGRCPRCGGFLRGLSHCSANSPVSAVIRPPYPRRSPGDLWRSCGPPATLEDMTSVAAVVAVVVALAVGFYWARMLRAERSLRGAKRDHAAAGRAAWAARRVMILVAAVLVLVVRAWLQGKGR